jgi:hypothetical protein
MEETDQELKDLLHYLNLPGAPWARPPARSLRLGPGSAAGRRRYAAFAGPAHVSPHAADDPVCRSQPGSANILLPRSGTPGTSSAGQRPGGSLGHADGHLRRPGRPHLGDRAGDTPATPAENTRQGPGASGIFIDGRHG